MQGSADYRFTCPSCAETTTVNEEMREAMLSKGCVICGTDVSASDFTSL